MHFFLACLELELELVLGTKGYQCTPEEGNRASQDLRLNQLHQNIGIVLHWDMYVHYVCIFLSRKRRNYRHPTSRHKKRCLDHKYVGNGRLGISSRSLTI